MTSATVVEWDVSGRCDNPRCCVYVGRSSPDQPRNIRADPLVKAVMERFPGTKLPHIPWDMTIPKGRYVHVAPGKRAASLEVRMTVPCRECDPCLRYRRRLWYNRARREVDFARRTWLVSLTLSPDNQYLMQMRATKRLHDGGTVYEDLTPGDQFAEHTREVLREVTLWTKRLRKASKAKLRGLIVVEKHKSGLPHVHVLIHENGDQPLLWKTISAQWKLGHMKANLVRGPKAAAYVTKYIAKECLMRIRASLHYGDPLGQGEAVPDGTGKRPQGLAMRDEMKASAEMSETRVKQNDLRNESTRSCWKEGTELYGNDREPVSRRVSKRRASLRSQRSKGASNGTTSAAVGDPPG